MCAGVTANSGRWLAITDNMAIVLWKSIPRNFGNVSIQKSTTIEDKLTRSRLNAIQNIGQLVALPLCAMACDRFGRVAILILGAFIILVGTALQGAAQNSE